MVQFDMIHAREIALLDFASSMLWVGDCKTNFEGSCGVQNPCTGDAMCLESKGGDVDPCQMCRPVARWNGGSVL